MLGGATGARFVPWDPLFDVGAGAEARAEVAGISEGVLATGEGGRLACGIGVTLPALECTPVSLLSGPF